MFGVIRKAITLGAINLPVKWSQCATCTTLAGVSPVKNNSGLDLRYQSEEAVEKDKLYSHLEVELRGIDPAVLKSFSKFSTTAAGYLGIEIGNCWAPRKAHHDRMTLLKSVHIFKKHRVQYEFRTHFRFMNFHKLTGSSLDTFLEYIERNLPEGVALIATKVEIQEVPDHLKETPSIE